MSNNYLHDFVFHFNCYTGKWNAVKRDFYDELFSGNKGNVVTSSSVDTLVSLINKYKGDVREIRQSVK